MFAWNFLNPLSPRGLLYNIILLCKDKIFIIANSMCIPCFISKQEALIRSFPDEHQKSEYMHRLLELLYEHGRSQSAPWIMEHIDHLYKDFWGNARYYSAIKHKYNTFLLQKERQIMHKIRQSGNPVKECIKYVCAGNFIDFATVADVSENTLKHYWRKLAANSSHSR